MLIRILTVLFLLIGTLKANDAGINEGAYGPQPIDLDTQGESPIRMVSENLHIRFGLEKADVVIDFVFQNTNDKPIHQKIGFPDVGLALKRDSRIEGAFPNPGLPLTNLKTFIDNREAPDVIEFGKIYRDKNKVCSPPRADQKMLSMAWHTAAVDFPAGKTITVRRAYSARHGYYPYWCAVFMYFTVTGAQWQGSIGKLDVTVELVDGLKVKDLEWKASRHNGYKVTMSPQKSQWKILSSTQMRFTWQDFEPAKEKDHQWFRLVVCDKKMTREYYEGVKKEMKELR
ncbi:MAG: DUF4424 family protein [Chthoniobacterales bacterium]